MYASLLIMNLISYIIIWMNHPISMGLLIIIQTINVSLILGMTSNMFWFSYIIIITMLSGMLVLFIYMASVASNEKFKNPIKMVNILIILIIMNISWQYFMPPLFMEFNKMQSKNNLESIMSMNLMNNNLIILFMVLYLFFSMMIISLTVNISEGPLRTNK
uniref:NADH dehydrogenase subunit 6 n=1 Tax=Myrmoplasta mira TaxID=2653830 RepID=A0A5P8DK44_9HEMI|nr:NADH dehydrogenase subunit 6 [Myrmoplasta mira]